MLICYNNSRNEISQPKTYQLFRIPITYRRYYYSRVIPNVRSSPNVNPDVLHATALAISFDLKKRLAIRPAYGSAIALGNCEITF